MSPEGTLFSVELPQSLQGCLCVGEHHVGGHAGAQRSPGAAHGSQCPGHGVGLAGIGQQLPRAALPGGVQSLDGIAQNVYAPVSYTHLSQYLRDGELEPLREQIEQRKVLQAQLKELQAKMPKVRQPKLDFETSVVIGKGLVAMSQGVKGWGLRDCFGQLEDYLYSSESDRVCLVFGLRRTGKTTMLRQAIARMNKEDLSRTTYIKARRSDTMAMMNRDLKKLFDAGFR